MPQVTRLFRYGDLGYVNGDGLAAEAESAVEDGEPANEQHQDNDNGNADHQAEPAPGLARSPVMIVSRSIGMVCPLLRWLITTTSHALRCTGRQLLSMLVLEGGARVSMLKNG
jgi:hypothetical protein